MPCQRTASLSISLSLSALNRRQVVAPFMLTDPSQHSKHQKKRVMCSCSTQHFRGRPGCFLQVSNCPEPWRDETERCRAWWAGAAWSTRLTWPKRECLLRLIASFMDGSCKRVATSTFVTNLYQRMPSIRLWFVIWKASSFAISAFNSVHVSEAYISDDRTHEL